MKAYGYCLKCLRDTDIDEGEVCDCTDRGMGWLILRPDEDSLPEEAGLGQFSIIDTLPENFLLLGKNRSTFWTRDAFGVLSIHYSND